jgi:diguanylate cyclase (GGDEF)-like protein
MPPELGDMKTVFLALLADSPDAWHRDNEIFTRSRERRLVRWNNSVLRSGAGEVIGIASIGEDITEQKQSEEKIRRLNRVYTVLSGINTLIVRARDRNELYREACRIAVEAGQFVNADISMFDHEMKELTIVASSSTNAQYLEQVRKMHRTVLDADSPEMKTVHDRLFVQRQVLVINNVEHDLAPSMRGPSRSINAGSLCVLPLVIAERTIGVFVLRAREAGFFDAEETKLLVELAGDIAFALDHLDKTAKLDYLAYYDQLTGLANATLFRERLAQSLLAAKGQPLALALLDVERFKTLNDALGRPAGDTLLKQLAGRLVDCIGSPDQVAHLDADHFALILTDAKNPDEVARMIEHELRYALAEPFLIDGTDFTAAVKIGIALSPGDGADADTLFRNAEAALKKAKAGGERYLFYAQHMTERVAERLALENKLRRALEREEFVLHYQPKVALDTRRIVGVEALIRWNDPATGLVPPMQFIPLMEETGLILQVGAWALRQAVKDHQRWLALGLAAPRIAVNVSAIQLRQNDFVEGVRRILAEGGSPPGIDIEITESLIMDDVEGNIGKLNAIRDMGLVIAIDDFGTGYSSLAYLARLPVGTVKIDRSFIITMLQEPNTMTLVSTTISLAHSLGLKVVAEGVDKEEQAAVLRSLGCDEMQGYLFSKPVPFEEMSALISNVGDSTTRQDRP